MTSRLLYLQQTVRLWIGYLASLCFCFHIREIKRVMPISQGCWEDYRGSCKQSNLCRHLEPGATQSGQKSNVGEAKTRNSSSGNGGSIRLAVGAAVIAVVQKL
jgi:hypothetical protein